MATRTFLALPLNADVQRKLVRAQEKLSSAGARVRWVAGENLHLTVKFLGDVADEALDEVCRLAAGVAAGVQPFEFQVAGLVAVPPRGQLRMVWAEVAEPTGRLAALNQAAEDACAAMGFKRENRQFRPHLTLGRVKPSRNADQLRAAVAKFAETDFGTTAADELVVMASQLTPDGPVHTPLATAPIGG